MILFIFCVVVATVSDARIFDIKVLQHHSSSVGIRRAWCADLRFYVGGSTTMKVTVCFVIVVLFTVAATCASAAGDASARSKNRGKGSMWW